MWAHITNTLLGLWLMFAPAVLAFRSVEGAAHFCYIIGPILATISYIAVWEANRSLRYANLPVSIILVFAPFLIEFTPEAALNTLMVGLFVFLLSLVEGRRRHSYHGGWSALFRQGDLSHDSIQR